MQHFSHPYNHVKCCERLTREYLAHEGQLLVAFDFDNTVFDYHGEGGDYSCVINLLREAKSLGMKLILFTTEDNMERQLIKECWCEQNGIAPDYVNKSPVMVGSIKPYYNILLDDRAGLVAAFDQLSAVIDVIKSEKLYERVKASRHE